MKRFLVLALSLCCSFSMTQPLLASTVNAGTPYVDILTYTYYHMNWGDGSSGGWFLDGLDPNNYIYSRKDLVNIYPAI